jgi:hypothetical protein
MLGRSREHCSQPQFVGVEGRKPVNMSHVNSLSVHIRRGLTGPAYPPSTGKPLEQLILPGAFGTFSARTGVGLHSVPVRAALS